MDLKITAQKTGDRRQANQIAISRRQMRSSNRHITSVAACYEPNRHKNVKLAQQGRPVRRQYLPRTKDD